MVAITASRAKARPIGELARLTGVNIETIRYYERISLLPRVARTQGGHRLYGAEEVRLLAFVRRARELGFSLDQIRSLLKLGAPAKASCAQVRQIASDHLADIRAKIRDLGRMERLLAGTIKQCTGKTAPHCPILDVLDVGRIEPSY